jgi:hypothetical protein
MERVLFLLLFVAVMGMKYLGWVPGAGRILSLVAVLVLVVIARYLVRALGKAAVAKLPDAIHLERVATPEWRDAGLVDALTQPLVAAGFVEAGVYRVVEMEGVQLRLLRLPDEGIRANVIQHPAAETPSLELVSDFADGMQFEVSNVRGTIESKQPPGVTRVRMPGASAAALLARFRAERPKKPAVPAPVEGAAAVFEQAYAKDAAWRKGKGAPTAKEVARFVQNRYSDSPERMGGIAREAAAGAPTPSPQASREIALSDDPDEK